MPSVSFGRVTTYNFLRAVSRVAIPTEGVAPLGLGTSIGKTEKIISSEDSVEHEELRKLDERERIALLLEFILIANHFTQI